MKLSTIHTKFVIHLKNYNHNENSLHGVFKSSWTQALATAPWMLVYHKIYGNKKTDNFVRFESIRMYLEYVHCIASHSTMMVNQNLHYLALKIQTLAPVAIKTKWWRAWTEHAHAHITQVFEAFS